MSPSVSHIVVPSVPIADSAEGLRDAEGRIYQGWKTTATSMLCAMVGPSCIFVFCFGSFVIPLQQEFNWSVSAISFGATIITLMLIVTALVGGVLVDRIGARKMILGSMPFFAAGIAGLSFLPSDIRVFYVALVGVSLLGLGVWPVSFTKATTSWFDRNLGLALGITWSGLGVGAAILPALLAYIIPTYGWRSGYLVLGALAFAPWPIAFLFLKERRTASSGADVLKIAAPTVGLTFKQAAQTIEFKLIVVAFFILGTSTTAIVVHQVRILADAGLATRDAIALQSVLGVALLVGRLTTGWLVDRVRASLIMTALCLLAAVAIALFAAGSPAGTAPLSAVLVGFLIGAEFDVLGFVIPRYFGRLAFGAIWGAMFSTFQVASGLGISLAGAARTHLGSYVIPLSVMSALLLVGAALFLKLGPYRFAPPARPH